MLVRAKVAVARLLCHPAVGRAVGRLFDDEIPSGQLRIDTRDGVVTPGVKAMVFWHLYERAELRFIRNHLRPDLDVVELGSSLGVVASHIANRLPAGRRLNSVEADPNLLPTLRSNLARNARHVVSTVIHGAIDYDVPPGAPVKLALGETNLAGRVGHGTERVAEVPAIRLSSILAQSDISRYALVCDIEGAEWGLLQHDLESLSRCEQIIIELHHTTYRGAQVSVDDIVSFIQNEAGFQLRARRGPVCVFER